MSDNPQSTSEEPMHLVLKVPDAAAIPEVLAAVDKTTPEVTTETITRTRLSSDTIAEVDLSVLTEKQRQTLELALDRGYYERPRNTDLTELAEQLDLSKSAVSQRLRTAELKLIKNALGRYE